jgi:hypothetical protein
MYQEFSNAHKSNYEYAVNWGPPIVASQLIDENWPDFFTVAPASDAQAPSIARLGRFRVLQWFVPVQRASVNRPHTLYERQAHVDTGSFSRP